MSNFSSRSVYGMLANGRAETVTLRRLATAGGSQIVLLPAYFYPGALWTQLATAPANSVVIMNPASGPGVASDPNYVSAVAAAQGAGMRVIGYVDTNFAAIPTGTVEGQIDSYKAWYGVDGIFLDQASSSATDIPYYATLQTYIQGAAGHLVVLNPGTIPNLGYMAVADYICIFEGALADYVTWTPPSWSPTYAAKIAHLIYAAPTADEMSQALSLSHRRSAAAVYVTDDVLPNPWDTLPPYWSAEVRILLSQPFDLTVLAKIDDAQAQPLAGNMAQTMRNVVISNLEIEQSTWPGPPKRNDQVITQAGKTLTVTATDPIIVGGALIMHRLKTLGG